MPKSRIALVAVVTLLLATPSVIAGPLHDAVKNGDAAPPQRQTKFLEQPEPFDGGRAAALAHKRHA